MPASATMDLLPDFEEFTSCQYCKSSLRSFYNTSSVVPTNHTHLNCEKCGKFITLEPQRAADEEMLFICSQATPHAHCLCYDCGILYNVKASDPKASIVNQLQYNHSSDPVSPELDGKAQSNILSADDGGFSNAETILNGTTLVAQMAQQVASENAEHDAALQAEPSLDAHDGSTLFIGTIMALCVWVGIYINSREMRYLLWFAAVYWLTSAHFHDENVKNAVYSLFSCAVPLASLYVFEKTRTLKEDKIAHDIKSMIQFFTVCGCIGYFMWIFGPMQMFEFFTNDFMTLSMTNRIISAFIATSIASSILILTKNCLCLQKMVMNEEKKAKTMNNIDILEDVLDEVQVCDLSITESVDEMAQSVKITKPKKKDKEKKKTKRKRKRKKKKPVACH